MTGRLVVCVAAGLVGAALAAAAWPGFVAGAIIAPYEDIPRHLARGGTVPPARLADAAEAARVSLSWQARPASFDLAATISFVEARRAASAADQRAALERTVAALGASLDRAPAQAYGWLLLAQALRARDGVTGALEEPLRQSLRFAPWEHRLVMPRVDIALAAWHDLSPEFRAAMAGQIRRAVDTAPLALVRATRRHFALREVRGALAPSPVHLQRFDIVYLSPD